MFEQLNNTLEVINVESFNQILEDQMHQSFVNKISEQHFVFWGLQGRDYYFLLKNNILIPSQKAYCAQYIDTFNNFQYIVRDSLNITEIENAMVNNKHFVYTTFVDNPKLIDFLILKIEHLGYNKIDYIKNYAAGCYNFEWDTNFKALDYKISEDEKIYFHQICDMSYDANLFDLPSTSLSLV